MMEILNQEKYEQHYQLRKNSDSNNVRNLLLLMLLFASIGAIAWAIRGTSGWGGVDGTVLPGLMWGILWYYFAYRKGIDARGVVFWLGIGLALGGELGYGQYVGWIRGIFSVGEEIIYVDPWLGYLWLIICGIGWAAPGSIILGWALGRERSMLVWSVRSFQIIILLMILFVSPFVDWLGEILIKTNSSILFPNADLGLYTSQLDKHLERTVYTNTQNFAVLVWWIVALIISFLKNDKTTIKTGLLLGAGFGVGFMQSTLWTLGYGFAPNYIDWWKLWELNAGFNLGLLYALTFFWAIRNFDKELKKESDPGLSDKDLVIRETLYLAFAGSILLYFVGHEYFFWTGLALSLFYFVIVSLTLIGSSSQIEQVNRRKNILLLFSIFYLLFLMFHGGSERLGIILELYSEGAVSQYSWPKERVLIFLPVALIFIGYTIFKVIQILKAEDQNYILHNKNNWLSLRIIDLITCMGFIGALSIWPAKIGVIYAFFIIITIFAFNRIEQKFKLIEKQN